MFDVVIDYLFLLLDVKLIIGYCVSNFEEEVIVKVDDLVEFVVLVFKVMIDFYVGKLIFFCVYLGIMIFGLYVKNFIKGKCECVGCLL